jgi:DNA-binding transcriptional regulator YdaS (Cro superfamily)
MTIKQKTKTIKNSALFKAVEVFRYQSALADAIGVKQQNVWHWLYKTGVIPAEHVLNIEQATLGKGQMVTRHELRPDIYPVEEVA